MFSEIINYIEEEYVDPVNKSELQDKTIAYLLQELDPHSYYITPEEYAAMNEPLEGSFDGIGVQFIIQKDTIVIVEPLSGGPSEKVGIKAGDRIIKVNDSIIAGTGIRNPDVLKLLKGPKGSKVKVTIRRRNSEDLDFTITRDKIPIQSIDVAYMLNDTTGYIKVARFAKTTYNEFVTQVEKLRKSGARKLVIDLRGNGGGFMDAAIKMLDEFFEKGVLLVYTEGRNHPKQTYYSTGHGQFKDLSLAVLIDEGSASASEIFAGAIQDNDRGLIIGRRSFGKGLVQEQTNWPNGAATRLTIARYYTPSGRSIQKPYGENPEEYNEEYIHRYDNGELFDVDSIHVNDSLVYKTSKGRIVYGGGGIIPDIFVPADTTGGSKYYNRLVYSGSIYDFAFDYADNHRSELLKYGTAENFNARFTITDKMLKGLTEMAEERGVSLNEKEFRHSRANIERRIKAYIARDIWNNEGFYPIWNENDNVIRAALNNWDSLPNKPMVYNMLE